MNLNNITLPLQHYLDRVPMTQSERNEANQKLMTLHREAEKAQRLQEEINKNETKGEE